jgi:hypothetical protein
MMGILQSLKSRIGETADIEENFAAPTLWGTTSFIADEVVALRASYGKLVREMGSDDRQVIADQINKVALDGAELQKRFGTVVEVVSSMIESVPGKYILWRPESCM